MGFLIRLFVFLLFISPIGCYSQGHENHNHDSLYIEDIFIVDSSFYNGKKIYVFNDKSWEYENTFKVFEQHNVNFVGGFLKFSAEDLFSKNFKNHKVSGYDDWNMSKMTDTVKLDISNHVPPTQKNNITSGFKFRWGRWHNGIDYGIAVGTPIYAVWSGRVRYAQMNQGGFGNLIVIRHLNGLETFYAHLSRIDVRINQEVRSGDIIGLSGNTGRSTGPHLHFEVRFFDNPIDPELVLGRSELLVCSSLFRSKPGEGFSFLKKLNITPTPTTVVVKSKSRKTTGNM